MSLVEKDLNPSDAAALENIRNFKGKYPKQLWYLFLVEMWERFTFYGMRALLAMYISHLILTSDYNPIPKDKLEAKKIEFFELNKEELTKDHPRYYIETSHQKDQDSAESSSNKQYGLIQAFIYAMAFVGGMFADKIFGFRKSVFWGGILMALGTFLMAVPGAFTFYLGVSILIVGNGFFKPNISTMVGDLYHDNDPRRDSGFSLFYSGINIGALLSGLTIAYIGTSISWSLGFALAGVCMLMGLALFLKTQKSLGPIGMPPFPEKLVEKNKLGLSKNLTVYLASLAMIPFFFLMVYYPFDVDLTFLMGDVKLKDGTMIPYKVQFSDLFMIVLAAVILGYLIYVLTKVKKEEFGKLLVAVLLIIFSALFWSFFEQGGGSLNYFANGNVASKGMNMTQVNNSLNSLWVVLLAPLVGFLWVWLSKRRAEPNTIVKFGLGFFILGLGFLVFAYSRFSADANGLTPLWIFIFAYLVVSVGELCLSPIGLSMITKLSPKRLTGMMMGTWFLASAYGQYGAGLIGAALASSGDPDKNLTNTEKLMQYTEGYQTIGIISLISGVVLIIISPILRKKMGGVK
ncbi:MAG: amino acid/peptide transporter [Fluviicola sp.]|jgi:POT family proton-dependent oligopeptide transporter|uniref:peptide MFS transporter n=1 Tax=Fluviicola sp. TaxID=1917219 RepID=UPI00262762C1|nr:peptide MFS transporter [Fluviicola sp.]MDF3029440.1 amino acid/peptide transporter [Fluviicola sp.]